MEFISWHMWNGGKPSGRWTKDHIVDEELSTRAVVHTLCGQVLVKRALFDYRVGESCSDLCARCGRVHVAKEK
jgi:hypothetical protein